MKKIEYNYEKNYVKVGETIFENFFDKNARIGKLGEMKFSEFLNKKNIPFLYFSQNPAEANFNDYSEYLIKEKSAKRPDFLINPFQYQQSLLIDVKCFKKYDNDYYTFDFKDIAKLLNLKNEVEFPVFLAVIDNENIENKLCFHLINVMELVGIKDAFLKQTEIKKPQFIPIHVNDLIKWDDELRFATGHKSIEDYKIDFKKTSEAYKQIKK